MATVQAMAWDVARAAFRAGFDAYQGAGPKARCPFDLPGDKRIGVWVAGKDAARRRQPLDRAWRAFRAREEAVM